MDGVSVVSRQNADIAHNLHLRDVARATIFWLSMDYNFGCMRIGLVFGVKLSHEDIAEI